MKRVQHRRVMRPLWPASALAGRPAKSMLLAATCGLLLSALTPAMAARTTGSARALPRTSCIGWSHVATVRERGIRVADGFTGSWERLSDVRRGWWLNRDENALYREADGYDGLMAWSQDLSGASHFLDAASARRVSVTRAWLTRRGWCVDRSGYSVSRLGARDDADGFRVVPATGAPVDLWFGRHDGLLDRVVLRLNENHLEIRSGDWRTVDGALFPFEQRFVDPEDEEEETVVTRSLQVNPVVSRRVFTVPAAPRDVFMTNAARRAIVPLILDAQKPLVNVMIDGKGPFPFVVDTGAHLHIDADVARHLGIVTQGLGNGTGQGTQISKSGFARVRELRIGAATLRNQVAIITPYRWATIQRSPHAAKAGWLGLELFERFRVTFDVRHSLLELVPLHAPRAPPPGARLHLTFDGDAPLVPCTVDTKPGPCMIDTGNAGETIVEAEWAARAGLATRFGRGLDAHDGRRIARSDIRVGSIRSPRELTEYYGPTPRGSESTTVEAAILSEGFTGAYRMTVDYADRSLWLDPRRAARPRPYSRTGILAAKERSGDFRVAGVLPHSSGARAGIRPGDLILSVNGRSALVLSSSDLWAESRRPTGSILRLRIHRPSSLLTFEVPIKLADIVP